MDESGSPPASDVTPYYILGGLVIREKDWKKVDNGVDIIKKTYKLKEVHTRRIWNKHKKAPHRTYAIKVIGEIYSLLAGSDVTLFCMCIDKGGVYRSDLDVDVERLAWHLLVERLNICVDKLCRLSGIDEYGLIIMDEKSHSKDLRIKDHLRQLRQEGTVYQRINRIIEDPVFTPSHWRNLIQLADSIVCCAHFHLRKESFFSQQFLTLSDKFDKDSKGNINNAGFKIW